MNCGHVANQVSAYIDRELTGAEMLCVRRHLSDCERCRSEYETLCRMKMLLGRLQELEPGPEFVARTIRRWQGQAQVSPSRPRPAWLIRLGLVPWPRLTLGLTTAALAASLVFTSISLRKPRHPDPLVDSSRIAALQGQDPESQQVPYWSTSGRFYPSDWARSAGPRQRLDWVTASLQGHGWYDNP
jgi:anti-sigma factor RsiW